MKNLQHVEAASTLAVIASSNEPLLFLSGDLRVIAVSASFCRTFRIDPAGIPGRQISEIGAGEWAIPQLISLLNATGSGIDQVDAYEIDIVSPNGKAHSLLNYALDEGSSLFGQVLAITFAVRQAMSACAASSTRSSKCIDQVTPTGASLDPSTS